MNFVFPGTASELNSGTQNVTEKLWLTLWSFALWKVLLLLVVLIAPLVLPATGAFFPSTIARARLPESVWVWGNFDGAHYVSIARSGYFPSLVPFFPLYPYLIKMAVEVSHASYIVVGQVISIVSLWFSLLVVYYLIAKDGLVKSYQLLLLILLTFPTSFYYAALYNDALFFLFGCLTVLFARRREWILVALMSALATLARLNGLALSVFIFLEYCVSQTRKENRAAQWDIRRLANSVWLSLVRLRKDHAGLLAILSGPLAFTGYLLWVERVFGNWNLVFSSMSVWQQDRVTLPLQVVWRYLKILFLTPPVGIVYWRASLELFFVGFYVFLLLYSFKKIRFSYWIFFLVSIIIPSLTGTFAGMPRYGLHLYPFFLALTLWVEHLPNIYRKTYFVVSIGMLVIFLALFSRGYFVS